LPENDFITRNLRAPVELLERVGLTLKGRNFFAGRLMIPIYNERGDVIGFSGRVLGEGKPKYKNTPTTEYFEKRRTLYNIHNVYKHLKEITKVYLVEGYMDVFALWKKGLFGVAPMGTSLTEEQSEILKGLNREICVVFDGDEAGLKGAERAVRKLLSAGCSKVKVVMLPKGEDPDSYLKDRNDLGLFQQGEKWLHFFLSLWGKEYIDGEMRKKEFFELIGGLQEEDRLEALNEYASTYEMELKRLVEEMREWEKEERRSTGRPRVKLRKRSATPGGCFAPEELPFLKMVFFGELVGLGALVAYLDEEDLEGELSKYVAKSVKDGEVLELSELEEFSFDNPFLEACLEKVREEKHTPPIKDEGEVLRFLLGLKVKRLRNLVKRRKPKVEVFRVLSEFLKRSYDVLKKGGEKEEVINLLETFQTQIKPMLDI
jgi:DNA primase